MTAANYKKSQFIKCITPITQEMAEMKIKRFVNRRRSVANITPSVHKLFKLDPDLMRIREEYLQRSRSQNNDSDEEDINDNDDNKQMMTDDNNKVDQTNNCDELNVKNDSLV